VRNCAQHRRRSSNRHLRQSPAHAGPRGRRAPVFFGAPPPAAGRRACGRGARRRRPSARLRAAMAARAAGARAAGVGCRAGLAARPRRAIGAVVHEALRADGREHVDRQFRRGPAPAAQPMPRGARLRARRHLRHRHPSCWSFRRRRRRRGDRRRRRARPSRQARDLLRRASRRCADRHAPDAPALGAAPCPLEALGRAGGRRPVASDRIGRPGLVEILEAFGMREGAAGRGGPRRAARAGQAGTRTFCV
jgi:hypothetical protein